MKLFVEDLYKKHRAVPFPIFVYFLLFLMSFTFSELCIFLSLLPRESHCAFTFSKLLLFLCCPPLDPQTPRASLCERHLYRGLPVKRSSEVRARMIIGKTGRRLTDKS